MALPPRGGRVGGSGRRSAAPITAPSLLIEEKNRSTRSGPSISAASTCVTGGARGIGLALSRGSRGGGPKGDASRYCDGCDGGRCRANPQIGTTGTPRRRDRTGRRQSAVTRCVRISLLRRRDAIKLTLTDLRRSVSVHREAAFITNFL